MNASRLALWIPIALAAVGCRQAPPGDRPLNVLLVVVDSLRRDHLGCYGYERATSPNVDRFARDATLFTGATSQASWTTPAMGALLSSQYPTTLGIHSTLSALPDEAVLLSEVLESRGYATGAVVSHSFCSSQCNFHQGFQEFDESNVLGHDAVSSPGVTDRALEFLQRRQGGPFFLWVHYFDPHFGYVEHSEWPFTTAPGYDGPVKSGMTYEELWSRRRSLKPDDVDQIVRFYDSEIAFTDLQIGRLLDGLRALGLNERTLVVFTADHGEEFMDHAGLFHGKTLYSEVVRVPLIARIPGLAPGVVDRPVASVDLFPTILDALAIDAPGPIAGRSLLRPTVESGEAGLRPVFSELDTTRGAALRSVVMGGLKLVRDLKSDARQVFDLAADPGETKNLAATVGGDAALARKVAALDRALGAWIDETGRHAFGASEVDIGDEERKRLEELGYGDR